MAASDTLCILMAAVYAGFGITLAIAPDVFFGPESPLSYWTTMGPDGVWFGRAAGVWMTFVTTSPYWAGIPKDALCKVYLPINLIVAGLIAQAAFLMDNTGPGKNALLPTLNLWVPQVAISVAILLLNLAVVSSPKVKSN
jgi:hypothetical protein